MVIFFCHTGRQSSPLISYLIVSHYTILHFIFEPDFKFNTGFLYESWVCPWLFIKLIPTFRCYTRYTFSWSLMLDRKSPITCTNIFVTVPYFYSIGPVVERRNGLQRSY